MKRNKRSVAVGPLALFLVLAMPSLAHADKPAGVVLPFTGWKAQQARRAVVRSLAGRIEILSDARFRRLALDIDADIGTAEGLAEVSDQLELDVVIRGRVKGKGNRARTIIEILGPDGEVVARHRGPSPAKKRGVRRIGEVARAAFVDGIQQIEDDEGDVEDDKDDDFDDEPVVTAPRRVAAEPRVSRPVPKDEEDEPIMAAEREVDATASAPRASSVADTTSVVGDVESDDESGAFLDAQAGIGLRLRTAKVNRHDDAVAKHASGTFPEVALAISAHPFSAGFASGLFTEFQASFAFGISSSAPGTEEAVENSAFRLLFQTGYEHSFGALTLGAQVGFGVDDFSVGANSVIGSATYSFGRIGASAGYAIVDEGYLDAQLGFGLRPVISTGEIGLRYYQRTAAFGYDLGAGVSGAVGRFTYGAGLSLALWGLGFQEDLEPSPTGGLDSVIGASTGSDMSFAMTVLLGYRLD